MDGLSLKQALETVAQSGETFQKLFVRSDFDAGLYKPDKTDPQTPHQRDEVYIVASGSGTFVCNGEAAPFKAGDFFFVATGVEHRFKDFTDDFATWVIFFGTAPKVGD